MSSQTKQAQNQSRDAYIPDTDDWQQFAERGVDQMREMVGDNAGRSMLIALGAGLGVGFMIGTALGGSSRSSREWGRFTAEGLGRTFRDRIETLVPDVINDRFKG
ncbi:hypothetical protein [Adhaeretor mobilis]|uniref:YtxH domain-containing protein n=1 Tax=Adhaeretor mobilis TaxID=1930276 RepID=A0A517MX70_9BACT|nr:hypothetical protein [Adhaeretor mobilis]QDS99471.1 hypothetical protein HG15A2_27940 [Adhaeretor mobilis]